MAFMTVFYEKCKDCPSHLQRTFEIYMDCPRPIQRTLVQQISYFNRDSEE